MPSDNDIPWMIPSSKICRHEATSTKAVSQIQFHRQGKTISTPNQPDGKLKRSKSRPRPKSIPPGAGLPGQCPAARGSSQ